MNEKSTSTVTDGIHTSTVEITADGIDMRFSTTVGEETELCQAALDELSDNKGEDD